MMDDKLSAWQTLLAMVLSILFIMWAASDPFGYWAGVEEEERLSEERWNTFSTENNCTWVGEDMVGDVRGVQYLCTLSQGDNVYDVMVVKKGDNSWMVTAIE